MTPIYKNGKYGYKVVVNYKDESTGDYKQIVRCNERTRTKTDAKQYEVELLATLKEDTNIKTITFEELYYKFIDEKKNDLKRNTLSYYKLVIPNYVFPKFQNKRVDKITKEQIIKWKEWMQQTFDFRIKYYNNIFTCFSAIMNYAVKVYDLESNPLSKVGKFKAPELIVKDDIDDYWTFEQFKVFIDKVREHYESQTKSEDKIRWHSLYTMYNILFYSGLRKSEANCLLWEDIKIIRGTPFLDVYKSINQRISPYEITTTKNKSSIRKVPICDELMRVLQEQKELMSYCYGFDDKKWFICGTDKPLAKNTIGLVKCRIEKECNLSHIKIHSFRHSYCSLLINANIPLYSISKLLGHSTTKITEAVYSHMYPETNQVVIDYLDKLK